MSQQERRERRKLNKRKNLFIALLVFLVLVIIAALAWRSQRTMILKQQDYKISQTVSLSFYKDEKFMELDDFKTADLSVTQGTKAASYQPLTSTPFQMSQSYIDQKIGAINTLMDAHYYEKWDQYKADMLKAYSQSGLMNDERKNQKRFFVLSAEYIGMNKKDLEAELTKLKNLNTKDKVEVTLDNLGDMPAGYVFGSFSDFNMITCEPVVDLIDQQVMNIFSQVSTDTRPGIREVSNDHMMAVFSVEKNTYVQAEKSALKLKNENSEGMSISEYYSFLENRVDLLRQYPLIQFQTDQKSYEGYLINVIEDGDQKLMILMMKNGIGDFLDINQKNVKVDLVNFMAWVVPKSAIIHKDGKTYIMIINRDHFEEQVEVQVSNYNGSKAALSVSENSQYSDSGSLKDGLTIRIYP